MSKWTRFRDRLIDWILGALGLDRIEIDAEPPRPVQKPVEPAPEEPEAPEGDEAPFASFRFDRGGFRGAGARIVPGAMISGLSADREGMSYGWTRGGCELLGAKDRGDASCLACLFVRHGEKWIGGKFDWISTSRTRRSFENIHGNYHGWRTEDLDAAEAVAFVIISRDGKRRTNVIVREGRL